MTSPAIPYSTEERVVLVDERDAAVGVCEKHEAHRLGLLHRAFSVFVLDGRGRVLLQRRSPAKYHSGGLWANTACGHPRPDEPPLEAARRRLREEMGLACDLAAGPSAIYRARLDGGMTEHELVHLFFGTSASVPEPDPAEVAEWRWETLDTLRREATDGERFAVWVREYVRLGLV